MAKRAVLLVNLGSPDSTSTRDVRRYLDEFLSDDRVLDIPKPVQQFVLKCFILPRRPKQSAHAYAKVWRPEGSPLTLISRQVRDLLSDRVDQPVHLAMRYGSPSIPDVIRTMADDGTEEIFLVPLYPHYAMSSYETVVARVHEVIRERHPGIRVTSQQPFFDHPDYIEALFQSTRPHLEKGYDHLLFSYHGIPVRHLRKADSSRSHCTIVANCCETCSPAHATCYKAQCLNTTAALVARAGIAPDRYSVSFQSRLAGEPWLQPYTDFELERFGKQGIGRLLVITPAFVSDCLETLEEIAMAGRDTFLEAGGREFEHIPCLNDHPAWIQFLTDRVNEWNAQP
ncbi:MAG: ferrochelatase [Opitutaceae bacterium]